MEDINPSKYQKDIIIALKEKNVTIDAVAGCGKTTTAKFISMVYKSKNVLSLMFNKKQRREMTESFAKNFIHNNDIHTFNSYAYRFYDKSCYNDIGLKNVIKSNTPTNNRRLYDILIVDEAQDLTELHYNLIMKIIKDSMMKGFRMVIFGDFMQNIYDFKDSNIKYLTNSAEYFPGEWIKLSLPETYRMTKPMVEFVNDVNMFYNASYDRCLISNKLSAIKPSYYVVKNMSAVIESYLEKYSYKDIFILAPSVKNNKLNIIFNNLSMLGVPIYISNDYNNNEDIMRNKLIISTVHVVKGLERKLVILLDFDDKIYPKYYNADMEFNPVIYVAMTRALEELVIFHDPANKFIIPKEIVTKHCNLIMDNPNLITGLCTKKLHKMKNISVTDLVKFLSVDKITKCMEQLTFVRKNIFSQTIEIENKVESVIKGAIEDVSDINGVFIPLYYSGFNVNLTELQEYYSRIYKDNKFIYKYCEEIEANKNTKNIGALLRLATLYNCMKNNQFYKAEQIKNYNWMTKKNLKLAIERLSFLSQDAIFEVPHSKSFNKIKINGIADCIDQNTLWEFKCAAYLDETHILQLALYSFIFNSISKFKLFNIITGEVITVKNINTDNILNILLN